MAALRGASRCLASVQGRTRAGSPTSSSLEFATEDTLAEAFSRYGQVIEATIVTDKMTNRPKGFGFVKFVSQEETNNAREGRDERQGIERPCDLCRHCKGQTGP